MKIGIYSPYLNTLGGGERYILTIAEYLSKKNDVSIFWDENLTEKAFDRLSINLKRVQFVDNIFSSKHFLFKRLNITRQYDLLIFLSDGSLPFSLARHNIIHFQQPFIGVSNIFNSFKLKKVDYVVCNSHFTKKYIDQAYNVDSKVISPPVQTKHFSSTVSKHNLIISVGRFHPFKKQKEMIKAFLKLNHNLNWQLFLIGGLLDQDREYFEDLKKEAGNVDNIRLLPNEPFENLKKYYSQAAIYWHAAGFEEDENKHPERMEHFGMTTVEAMASGCIPLVYDGGGQREIVKHGVNGYLWKTEKDLISLTVGIIKDQSSSASWRIKVQKEAVKDSKKYDKKVFIEKFDSLIKSLK